MADCFANSIKSELKIWKEKNKELKKHFSDLKDSMLKRQKKELDDLHNQLKEIIPIKVKPSSALLNLKAIQKSLSSQKRYTEANEVKEKVERMEKEENEKWNKIRKDRIAIQESQIIQKHNKEQIAHKKRRRTAFRELRQDKEKNIKYIKRNYENTQSHITNTKDASTILMSKSKIQIS